ncbi:MAG: hypothetical protein KKF44_00965 [Nanoarchaeota archaeon]|nr:hypothetical protein [Nanoarchaeota archaeon]
MKFKKKGLAPGPATHASMFILIMGIAIILYILMLPPADRAELLGENGTNIYDDGTGDKNNITVLVLKEPGTLNFLGRDEVEIQIPSFNLFTKTDSIILVDFDSVYVKKSLFDYDYKNITFELKDMENIDNFMLSFRASKRSGILKISLNGNMILNKELANDNPAPLRLPVEYLEKKNVILFEVSSPGMNFWQANEYILENIKITADITDLSGQENRQTFLISKQEKEYLKEGINLRFISDCNLNSVGYLSIFLNNYEIYKGIPDCGQTTLIPPISKDRVLEGDNTLRFNSEKGNYLLYAIRMDMELEEPVYPTYYFTLEKDKFKNLEDGIADLNLTLLFTNDEEYKKGQIWLNGHITEIDTDEYVYSRNLNYYARENNNALEIRPKTDKLEITELKLVYAE